MDTLITGEKKPRSGLYTLQFSYMPMASGAGVPSSSSSAETLADPNVTGTTATHHAERVEGSNTISKENGTNNNNNSNNTNISVAAAAAAAYKNSSNSEVIDMNPPTEDDLETEAASTKMKDLLNKMKKKEKTNNDGADDNTGAEEEEGANKHVNGTVAGADGLVFDMPVPDDGDGEDEEIRRLSIQKHISEDESQAAKEARVQAINKACATEFGSWTLLCRLRFEGDVMGRIKGSVKVKTRPQQPTATTAATTSRSVATAAAASAAPLANVIVASSSMTNGAPSSSSAGVTTTATTAVPPPTASFSAPPTSSPVTAEAPTGLTQPPPPPPAPLPTAAGDACCQPSSSPSVTTPLSSSSGTRACIQPGSVWKPSDEVRLIISLDRLDGAVVGLQHDLTNVTIHCYSHVNDGWLVGTATIALSNGEQLKLPRRLQFLLREYTGPRCSHCLDPIDISPPPTSTSNDLAATTATTTAGSGDALSVCSSSALLPILTCDGCQCVQYCSHQCRDAHAAGHKNMCAVLKPFGLTGGSTSQQQQQSYPSPALGNISGVAGGGGMLRACASFAGAEFFVYWRCVRGCMFELIADHTNPLGVPYAIVLNTLKDAREGLDYCFLPSPTSAATATTTETKSTELTTPTDGTKEDVSIASNATTSTTADHSGAVDGHNFSQQELNELNVSIFFAVAQSSRLEGALLLTAACLNHLFTFCDCVDNLVLSYFQFYDACVRDQFEGVRQISCLGEYVMYVRTTFELGQTLLEWALKAPFASLFWQRLVAAKDVLVSLYNFNASLQFSPPIQNVKPLLVPDQQRQTLHLLARIFVVMASRAPKDLAQRLLRRAEECYKDSIDEDKPRKNFKEMGTTCLKLAALATLFESDEDKQKSKLFKEEGVELLKLAAKSADPNQAAKIQQRVADGAAQRADAAALAIANNNATAAATGTPGTDPGAAL